MEKTKQTQKKRKKKVRLIDYHGRRSGVIATIATDIAKREGLEAEFYSGGLPDGDGGNYKQESDRIVGSKYALPFKGTEAGGLVELIENTEVGPVNQEEIKESDLVLTINPHIIEGMKKAGLDTEKAQPLMQYLGYQDWRLWIDAPDYVLERIMADIGKGPKKETYSYISVFNGQRAIENSQEAFALYSGDAIRAAKELVYKLKEKENEPNSDK
jgi:hypothetical protein